MLSRLATIITLLTDDVLEMIITHLIMGNQTYDTVLSRLATIITLLTDDGLEMRITHLIKGAIHFQVLTT